MQIYLAKTSENVINNYFLKLLTRLYMSLIFIVAASLFTADIPQETTPPQAPETVALHDYLQKTLHEPGSIAFSPPMEWRLADPKTLPKFVKMMVVGESSNEYPPSINLGFDPYKGTKKSYLKMIKEINDSQGAHYTDLGSIKTEAGDANLVQVDTKTKWGVERQMQVIFFEKDCAWILTCSSLKDEFSKHYKTFFDAMKSLRKNKIEK